MARSPAFRFYPSDFLGSPDVQVMDLHEIGAYTLLLCTAWNSERHGYLPDDENLLRRWAHMTKDQWGESRELLLKKFPLAGDGWRCNPRMVKEAEKQVSYSAAQSAKGSKGGRPKKLELYETKLELSKEKPEESRNKAPAKNEKAGVKPSVCVSVFASVSDCVSEVSTEANTLASTALAVPAIFELPLVAGKGEWGVSQMLYSEMVSCYPGVNVMTEFGKMRAWLITNPTRRKTPKGLPAFINNWLSGAQNKGGNNNARPTATDASIEAKKTWFERHAAQHVVDGADYPGRTIEAGDTGSEPRSTGSANGALFGTAR